MMKKHTRGFTLIELLVTISIIGIMAALAFPSMVNFINSTRIVNRSEQIANLMRFAKTEAIRRNAPVIVCGVLIRSDGRPLGNCSASHINSGMRAFVDIDRNGEYTANTDVNLRTISLNGNSSNQQVVITPTVYALDTSGAVNAVSDTRQEFIFMPNGSFGRKTANDLKNLELSKHYVRFQVSESTQLNDGAKMRTRMVVVNPGGKVNICRDADNSTYEKTGICTL